MTNITLNTVGSLQETTSAQSTINANNAAIVTAVEASVPITGTTMAGNVDMNSNRILNLPIPGTADEPLRLQDLSNFNGGGTVTNIPAGGISGQVLTSTGTPYSAVWAFISPNVSGDPLTATSDTNVTLSVGGSASTALLNPANITAGWQGTLAANRLNGNVVQSVTSDTNVTGNISSSSQALTLGWTGTLAAARLNGNVVQSVTSDTNVTGNISSSSQALTLGWTGTLAAARLNGNVVQSVTSDTNITGSIAASSQALTLGWAGTLASSRLNTNVVQSLTGNNGITGSIANGALTLGHSSFISMTGTVSGTLTLAPAKTAAAGTISIPNGSGTLLCTSGNIQQGTLPSLSSAVSSTMYGFGITFSTINSSRVHARISANVNQSANALGNKFQMIFGTGSAPTTGAAVTGTVVSNTFVQTQNLAANPWWDHLSAITGLTPGTTYWLDIANQIFASSGTCALANGSYTVYEI